MPIDLPIRGETLDRLVERVEKLRAQKDKPSPGEFKTTLLGAYGRDRPATIFEQIEENRRKQEAEREKNKAFIDQLKADIPVAMPGTPSPTPVSFGTEIPRVQPQPVPAVTYALPSEQVQQREAMKRLNVPIPEGWQTRKSVKYPSVGPGLIGAFTELGFGGLNLGMAFLKPLTDPIDVLTETGVEVGAQISKIVTGKISDVEAPTLFTEGFQASLDDFHDRSLASQIALGFADPFVLAQIFKIPARASIALTRNLVSSQIAEAAGRGVGKEGIDNLTNEVAQRISRGFTGEEIPQVGLTPEALRQLRSSELRRGISVDPTREEQLQALTEFGLVLDSSANTFAVPLRPFDDVIREVIVKGKGTGQLGSSGLLGTIAAVSGTNPSVLRATNIGKISTAYQRQLINIEQVVSVAMAATFDSHARVGVGQFGSVLPVDTKTGIWKGTNLPWQKFFESPDELAQYITPEARRLIDDVNQMTNQEVSRLLADEGIVQHVRSRAANEYYVPRNVLEIHDIELQRHTNHDLQLHYEDILEGKAAGIGYGTDPREDIELFMRWAYRKLAKKQFDEAMELEGVTARNLVPTDIRNAYSNALVAKRQLEKLSRRIKRGITTSTGHLRVASTRTGERTTQLGVLQGEIDRIDDILSEIPDLQPLAQVPTRIEVRRATQGVRAAKTLLDEVNRELTSATVQLSRVSGKRQGTVAELQRLDRQFDRLVGLKEEIAYQPLQQLLEGRAPIAKSPAAIRQQAARAARFGTLSTEATRAERSVTSAQRRFINLDDARVQLQRQVDLLKQDVMAGRSLSREAEQRLISARTKAEVTREQRGRIRGSATQVRRQQRRLEGQKGGQVRKVGRAARMEDTIKDKQDILAGQLKNIDSELRQAQFEYTRAQKEFTNYAKGLETSGKTVTNLFGPNQSDYIPVKMWRKKFFTVEDSKVLDTVLGKYAAPGILTRSLTTAANTRRFMTAVGDFAMPMIHGLTILATNPEAWGRMTYRHHQAFFDPTVQGRLIRENLEDYQWLATHEIPVGDPEFFAALQPGQGISLTALLKVLPKGKEAQRFLRTTGKHSFGRFQASYSTGLGWSRVLLLKGARQSWKGSDAELAQYIRNLTGGLDSRALGVGPSQRAIESVWLAFSPRLLRSTLALTKDAMNPTSQVGRRSLRTLSVLATGAITTYILTGMALQKDWDEIKQGLNPLNGKRFLSYKYGMDWIGVGGQIRSIAQLVASGIADPVSLLSTNRYDNPVIKFVSGRGAVGLSMAGEIIEGTTGLNTAPFDEIDGGYDLLKHTGKNHLPFVAQGILEGQGLEASVGSFHGLRTSVETVFDRLNDARVIAKQQLNFDLDKKLNIDEKAQVDELVPQEVHDAVAKTLIAGNSEIALFKRDNDRVDENINHRINLVAADGPGQNFREQLSKLNIERATRKDEIRNAHPEALKILEEFESSELPFDIAFNDYLERTNDPKLTNDLGEFDFSKRERRIKELKEDHGEILIEKVQARLRDEEHPLAKKLREDRELLKPYWAINERVKKAFPKIFTRSWDEYLEISDPVRRDIYVKKHPFIIKPMIKSRNSARQVLRRQRGEIDAALIRWGYGPTAAKSVKGFMEKQRIAGE